MSQEILHHLDSKIKPSTRRTPGLYRNYISTLAGLIAIGGSIVGCEKSSNQTPGFVNADNSGKTIAAQISTPETPQWVITPTSTPVPNHPIKPVETLTPVIPTKTPEPTRKPTPEPFLLPTPEPKEIKYLKPGESTSVTYFIQNQSGKPVKRFFDLVFEKGDSGNLKKEIRIPALSQEVFQEEREIAIPKGGANVTTIITVHSGASPTCFGEITLIEYSRETGYTDLPINKTVLDKNICISDSLQVFFSNHRVAGRDVFSDVIFLNFSYEEQEVMFLVPENKCYKAAQRDFRIDNKRMSELRVKIPARRPDENYGIIGVAMHSILAFDENRTPLPSCSIEFNPILKD